MASKVEELRDKVLGNYPKIATDKKGIPRIIGIIEAVDSLISASHAEGVAEGAAAEVAKIVHCRECKCGKSMPSPTLADLRARRCTVWHCTVSADGFCYAGDRDLLAPDKERP